MEIFVYRTGASAVEEGFGIEDLPELLRDESLLVWLDIDAMTDELSSALLEVFGFHPLTVEDCHAARHHPKIEEYPGYLFFIIHGVTADASPERFNTIELDGYLGQNYIVTYHKAMFRSINNVKQRVRSSPLACQNGPSSVLHQIIDQIVDFYEPVLDSFDSRIIKLEDRIFSLQGPDDSILEEVLNVKRGVLRLRRITAKQREIIKRMSQGEFALIPPPLLPFFRDVHDHLVRVYDMAENYRDLIGSTLDAYLSVISNRMNEVMKLLTLFSAVLLPMTLIAGIYGMNFDNIPETHLPYGYALALTAMFLVGGGMLYFFYRRGWIGNRKGKGKDGRTLRKDGRTLWKDK